MKTLFMLMQVAVMVMCSAFATSNFRAGNPLIGIVGILITVLAAILFVITARGAA